MSLLNSCGSLRFLCGHYVQLRDKLAKAYYTTDPLPEDFDEPLNEGSATRANVVVVGPIPVDVSTPGKKSRKDGKGTTSV